VVYSSHVMAPTKAKRTSFTATAPHGETFTRTSENRTYTHMVIVRRTIEGVRSDLAGDVRREQQHLARLQARIDSGEVFRGRAPQTQEWADGWVRKYTEELIPAVQAKLEAFEQNPQPGPWKSAGWCGRADLAQKLASKERVAGAEVQILEAVAGGR
jgi:hypothetical protein